MVEVILHFGMGNVMKIVQTEDVNVEHVMLDAHTLGKMHIGAVV